MNEEREENIQSEEERNEELVMPESAERVQHSHLGPILGVLVVVLVLILGGLYLWGSTLNEEPEPSTQPRDIENNEPETPRSEADTQILETVSSSDDLDAIEADLESTDLSEIETEIEKLEQELNAALESQE